MASADAVVDSGASARPSAARAAHLNLARQVGAEVVGTAVLVIAGVGTAVLAPQVGTLGVALAFGFALLAMAYALGPISGCHINPAVTLGMVLARRVPVRVGVLYVVGQIVGGIAGAGVVLAIATSRRGFHLTSDGLGTNGWGSHSKGGYGLAGAAIAEVVLTALLVLVVIAVSSTDSTAVVAGIPIGIALVVDHLVAIPIDGTSVNPARSIGPALVSGQGLGQLWLFVVAPLAGAVLAAVIHRVLALEPLVARVEGINADPTADPGLRQS